MEDNKTHFLSCLKEIQRAYIQLPKILRLRVEHWVEKLSLTGRNATWRKDRDMYTKMLLNMVLAKKLEAPFDKSPTDGPLPPFPSMYRCKLKEMIGPHETTFWRDVYSNISDVENEFQSSKSPPNRLRRQNTSSIDQTLARRETDNLLFLNQELDRRVLLLEQQLQEERLKHEIELQRLINEQRRELIRLKDTTENLRFSNCSQRLAESSMNQSHVFRDILTSTQEEKSPKKSPNFSANNYLDLAGRGEDLLLGSRISRPSTQIANFSVSTRNGSFPLSNLGEILPKQSSLDPGGSPNRILGEQEAIHKELVTDANLSPKRAFSELVHSPAKKSSNTVGYSVMDAVPSNDEDFLKYLEEFQDEIKNLRYK